MLPMMAALPLMAAWCRAQGVAPQTMVLLHLAAMFGPALLLRQSIARWSMRTLSIVCAILLASGAAVVMWAAAPLDLLGLAVTHGAAWGLAWGGQLWAPARRGQQGTSPLLAAAGYALVTLAFGLAVEQAGARGVAAVHVALGLGAIAAWLVKGAPAVWLRSSSARRHAATMSPPSQLALAGEMPGGHESAARPECRSWQTRSGLPARAVQSGGGKGFLQFLAVVLPAND